MIRPRYARLLLVFLAIVLASIISGAPIHADAADAGLPGNTLGVVDGFTLPSADGNSVSLASDVEIKFQVLCFLGTECPLARIYGPRLTQLAEEYQDQEVRFIGINSNLQDSMDDVRRYVADHEIGFPVAKDYDRQVALQAGATRTPEVFVVDRAGQVLYRGRIDDQYQPGAARAEATQHDLRDALDQLLCGEEVRVPSTTAVGCLIALPRAPQHSPSRSDITFCNQVSRILQQHCIECHRDGEIGPFALDDYDEVVGWADMTLEVIDQGRMPPWHASPEFGSFANARLMPQKDRQTLRSWVDAGMPYGDAADLPETPAKVEGWRLPESPHAVFEMSDQPFQVPAEGTVPYQYFVVDPGFKEDKWVSAVQVIPGNNAVVHHCIAFTRPPDGSPIREIGMLSAYVPGQTSSPLPDGYAQRIKAGSRIVFQMHYTPTGKPESDNTQIGLVFADPESVTHEVFALGGINQEFEIPPHAAEYTVAADIGWFPEDGYLLSIMPHMHLRGKSFRMTAETAEGRQTLLEVPQYDFNWQHSYELSSPLPLSKIRDLKFTAVFDNSADNPTNPDPSEYVTWGDQTWQEMAVAFIGVARPLIPEVKSITPPDADSQRERQGEWDRQAEEFADRYMARFDKNGDKQVTPYELPDSVRMFTFWSFDHNHDKCFSHDEIKAEALWRIRRSR